MELSLEQIVSAPPQGTRITVWMPLASTVGGALLAFAFAFPFASGIGSIDRFVSVRWLAKTSIQIFRGTLLLIQLFVVHHALPITVGLTLPALGAGIRVQGQAVQL